MRTYKFRYCDDDTAQLKDFICQADCYGDAERQLIDAVPELYYFEMLNNTTLNWRK